MPDTDTANPQESTPTAAVVMDHRSFIAGTYEAAYKGAAIGAIQGAFTIAAVAAMVGVAVQVVRFIRAAHASKGA